MKTDKEISVLFVCLGNICRSPTAEGVFRSVVKNDLNHVKNGFKINIDSAGTHAYHTGSPPDSRAQATALSHGVDLSTLVARKATAQDFEVFDYIIAMDNENLRNLKALKRSASSKAKASIHLFMEFAKNWDNDEVPDPYYGGDSGFEEVFEMAKDASNGLLENITKQV